MDPREHATQFNHGNSPEDVFNEYKARWGAMLKALTTDVERFFQECDPVNKELSLYGNIDGNWQVAEPPDNVPPDLPQPVVGINFARDSESRKEWLARVATHSDSWLLSVCSFYATKCAFDMRSRSKLFSLINSLPTLHDIVCPTENKTSNDNSKLNTADEIITASLILCAIAQRKEEGIKDMDKMEGVKEEEESEEEQECGHCGKCDSDIDNFWIFCDTCQRWFHGKCVHMTRTISKSINNYHCPECLAKRGRNRLE